MSATTVTRRVRNESGYTYTFPTIPLELPAGEEADIDFPSDQPCPDGLKFVDPPAEKASDKASDDDEKDDDDSSDDEQKGNRRARRASSSST